MLWKSQGQSGSSSHPRPCYLYDKDNELLDKGIGATGVIFLQEGGLGSLIVGVGRNGVSFLAFELIVLCSALGSSYPPQNRGTALSVIANCPANNKASHSVGKASGLGNRCVFGSFFNGMRQICFSGISLRSCDSRPVLAMPSHLTSYVSETYLPTLISSVMSLSTFTMYLFHASTSFDSDRRHAWIG